MTYIEHLLHANAFRCIVLHPVLPGACEVGGEEMACPGSHGREEAASDQTFRLFVFIFSFHTLSPRDNKQRSDCIRRYTSFHTLSVGK